MNSSGTPAHLRFPGGDGAHKHRQQSLRLLVVSDLAPGYSGGPIPINRDSFDAVLERLHPRLQLEVPDRIHGDRRSLSCEFTFTSLRSFHPDGLVEAQPMLRGLADARALLHQCLERKLELNIMRPRIIEALTGTDLVSRLEPPPATHGTTDGRSQLTSNENHAGDAVASLLQQVVLPEAGAASGAYTLVDLFGALLAPAAPAIDRPQLEGLIREIDSRLSLQVAAIQDRPGFAALESSWRGLKLLVDRLDFRAPIELEILPAERDTFLERFFNHVFHVEHEGSSDVPLSAVIADFGFGRTGQDLDTLRDMARFGSSLSVLFVSAMDPSFWGVRHAALVAKLPDLLQKAQGSEYAKWNRFRKEPGSEWLVLTANRFLLRGGEATATRPPSRFAWTVQEGSEVPLWGSAVWAMGVALGQSFSDSGILFPLVGAGSSGVLDNLSVVVRETTSGEKRASPLEVDFTDRRVYELAQLGFAALVSRSGADACHFNFAPSCRRPARYEDDEATQASFLSATVPYRLFAGAVAHVVERLGHALCGGYSPEEVATKFREVLAEMLAPYEDGEQLPDAVRVEVGDHPEDPALRDVTIRVRPGFKIYGGEIDLLVGTSIVR